MLDSFHFIRPFWLLAIPLLLIICLLFWKIKNQSQHWQGFIEKAMLPYLTAGDGNVGVKWPILLLSIGWVVASFALAGPAWQKLPQPQFVNQNPVVIVVDLSPSMLVEDIKPTRLAKMRFKLIDLLNARKEGLTALVVYAGDSHILAPLSDDTQTLISLVPTLSPLVMPISGSNVEEAIEQAASLIDSQGFQSASIILFTDGVTEQAIRNIDKALVNKNINLSVIGVGTEQGAPIPISNQGFAKDEGGNIVLAKLNSQQLQSLAKNHKGIYSKLTLSNDDIEKVLARNILEAQNYQPLALDNNEMDEWLDAGQWLLLILLPIGLLGFRRGIILQVGLVSMFIASAFYPQNAMALEWQDLWKTKNQQASVALDKGQYKEAASTFSNPEWQAVSEYKAENYTNAAEAFEKLNSADGFYNQGHALAQQGDYEGAIKAYDKALLLDPEMQDALHSKEIVEELAKKEAEKEKKENSESDQQSPNKDKQEDSESSSKEDSDNSQKDQKDGDQEGEEKEGESQSNDKQNGKKENNEESSTSADQKSDDENAGKKESDEITETEVEELKRDQQKKEQEALAKQATKAIEQAEDKELDGQSSQPDIALDAISQQELLEQEKLDNWLGQLPEDASRLMRNKFNYELQKKRQAYRNGQWEPTKEQRW